MSPVHVTRFEDCWRMCWGSRREFEGCISGVVHLPIFIKGGIYSTTLCCCACLINQNRPLLDSLLSNYAEHKVISACHSLALVRFSFLFQTRNTVRYGRYPFITVQFDINSTVGVRFSRCPHPRKVRGTTYPRDNFLELLSTTW